MVTPLVIAEPVRPADRKEKRVPVEKASQGWIPLDACTVDPQTCEQKTINRMKNDRGGAQLKRSLLELAFANGTLALAQLLQSV